MKHYVGGFHALGLEAAYMDSEHIPLSKLSYIVPHHFEHYLFSLKYFIFLLFLAVFERHFYLSLDVYKL